MDNNGRCDKCGGFIITDGRDLKCFNCGKRFIERDKLSQLYSFVCKKCGSTFYHPSKNRRLCERCRKKIYRKRINCVSCNKEFVVKDYKTKECPDCRAKKKQQFIYKRRRLLFVNM